MPCPSFWRENLLSSCGRLHHRRWRVLVQLPRRHSLGCRRRFVFAKRFRLGKLLLHVRYRLGRAVVRMVFRRHSFRGNFLGILRRCAFARHSPLVTRHFPTRRNNSLIAPQRLTRQSLKLLQTRQLFQIAQPKPHQEFLRRLIQNRPPYHFLPPRRRNQPLIQKRADHPRSIHSANLRNLRRSHRLLVSNHRKRFERRHRQPQRRPQTL